MGYFINFLEAVIAAYMICGLSEMKNKKLFFYLCSALTFFVEFISDIYQANALPLSFAYIFLWTILSWFFVDRKHYLYSLFVASLTNSLIDISVILPVIFVIKYGVVVASLCAKFNQWILTYLFLKYHQKYAHLRIRYWLAMICILSSCAFLIDVHAMRIVENTATSLNYFTIVISFVIVSISMFFFNFVDQSAHEKELVTKELEKKKYQNITYDIMKHSQDELNRLEHLLTYQLLLIKNEIKKGNDEQAQQLIDMVIAKTERTNHTICSGNDLLDLFLSLKFNELDCTVTPCIAIPDDDFYDNVQFIDLILELLDHVQTQQLNLILKEDQCFCVLQLISDCVFIEEDIAKSILNKYSDFKIRSRMTTNHGITILNIKIGKIK